MARIKSYVSKDFLLEFEAGYLANRANLDPEDRTFEKYDSMYQALANSEMKLGVDTSVLREIITGQNNPLLKYLFKIRTDIKMEPALMDGLKDGDGKEYFDKLEDRSALEIFCVDDDFTDKKIRRYMRYYGVPFFSSSNISKLKIREEFQVGRRQLDKEKIYASFQPFHSLIIIDPYLLGSADNEKKLNNFLSNLMQEGVRTDLYIDIITQRLDNFMFMDRFKDNINQLMKSFKVSIILKVHQLSKDNFHDRNYIGNSCIVNFGHGLSAMNDSSDSDIRVDTLFSKWDNTDFVKKASQKLELYKKAIRNDVGDNPIWKILD